ncbi:DUF5813 family protein [Halomarina pelagica]|uniref:DUF5813 family protein n=1 Tax=Halomarina pelagica TaxID=2961599 RepID=UPI0020C3B720|nr:DUF5813 family protein [Halomarina sp. BND7]
MTEELPERARRAFDAHDAYAAADGEYVLETIAFDGRVTVEDAGAGDRGLRYALTVRAPTLDAAAEEAVGPNLLEGWFETYEVRLEDAPGAVRADVELEALAVEAVGEEAAATFVFEFEDAERAPDVAKALAEYAEGTYAEGIVPGYTYRPPVSELLSRARQSGGDGGGGGDGDAGRGPMPL